MIGDDQDTADSIKVNKKENDIHSELIDVSDTELGTDSSMSDASNVPNLRVPIPAPRRILRNVPVATPRPSNVISLDTSDCSDSVLLLSNDVISEVSADVVESSNSDIEFSEEPAEVSADVIENRGTDSEVGQVFLFLFFYFLISNNDTLMQIETIASKQC